MRCRYAVILILEAARVGCLEAGGKLVAHRQLYPDARTCEELTLGIPGLVVWQIEEANGLLLARSNRAGVERS